MNISPGNHSWNSEANNKSASSKTSCTTPTWDVLSCFWSERSTVPLKKKVQDRVAGASKLWSCQTPPGTYIFFRSTYFEIMFSSPMLFSFQINKKNKKKMAKQAPAFWPSNLSGSPRTAEKGQTRCPCCTNLSRKFGCFHGQKSQRWEKTVVFFQKNDWTTHQN